MIQKIVQKILRPNSFLDLEMFLKDFEDFEEFPVISRCQMMDVFRGDVLDSDRSAFLAGIARFLHDNLVLYAKTRLGALHDRFFLAITYIDPEEEFQEYGYLIPHLLVSRKPELFRSVIQGSSIDPTGVDGFRAARIGPDLYPGCRWFLSHTTSGDVTFGRYFLVRGDAGRFQPDSFP